MKVLLVNTYDRGGAANSCKRLHSALLNAGVVSKVLLKKKKNNWRESYKYELANHTPSFEKKIRQKIKSLAKKIRLYNPNKLLDQNNAFIQSRNEGLELFSFPQSQIDITKSTLYKESDLINLHWVANFLDYKSFFEQVSKPVVWTLHDMNPFSGGEHYIEKFYSLDDSGFPVKRKITEEEFVVLKKNIEYKKKAISLVKDLTIVAPSKWLAEEARRSEVFGGLPVHHIPYSLDHDNFQPMNKILARKKMGIPLEKKVILFVADSIKNKRKGFEYLTRAFTHLDRKDIILCAVGKNTNQIKNSNLMELGAIEEKKMSAVYSAADVFVIPSIMDNLPNTVLESLMCGTPVIGFPVGGIPEMIEEGVNGMLTKEVSVASLTETIKLFLDSKKNYDRNLIRAKAVNKYGLQVQADRYIKLFEEIMNKKKSI